MTFNKSIKDIILSKLVKPGELSVGVEIESIIYTKEEKRLPVNSKKGLSAINILQSMNNLIDKNGDYSLEPGGQIEWSSKPYKNLNDLEKAIKVQNDKFYKILSENNLSLITYGVDPKYSPDDVELIKLKKYQLMNNSMGKSGTMGKWMMRCTSSIQVNFDFTSYQEMEEMVFIADVLHPVAAYIFSNSPFKNGKPTGKKNARSLIWENTDNSRCNNLFDHGIYYQSGLMDSYINYIYNVPGIFQLDRKKTVQKTTQSLGDRVDSLIKNGKIKNHDLESVLHQIFTNVRIKNLVEVRGADRTPRGYEIAPVAFWTGILTEKNTRKKILQILNNWTLDDRNIFNKCSQILDLNQLAPQNKSFGEWIYIFGEIALEGLNNRDLNETHLFNNFFDIVKDKGPFGLQNQ